MMDYYTGYQPGDIPANIPGPYYSWETSAIFGALVQYWYYIGDDKWNNMTTLALLHQVGLSNNFMPQNQTLSLGNDDQMFWGFAAMSAAVAVPCGAQFAGYELGRRHARVAYTARSLNITGGGRIKIPFLMVGSLMSLPGWLVIRGVIRSQSGRTRPGIGRIIWD
jgi:hypothetical protein